jgi:hypothetical protein
MAKADKQHGALGFEGISIVQQTTGKSLHPIILINKQPTYPSKHAPGSLHFKSRQRKVMQEDLATILIKVWINFFN